MPARKGQLTAADRRARAASGLTTRIMLSYVEREGGRAAVELMLAQAGMSGREDDLRDERAWFSFDTKMVLWAAAAEALGDPRVPLHAGEAVLDFSVGTGLKKALRALGTPEFVYRNVVRANAKFNWCHRLEVVHGSRGHARLRYVDLCGVGYHHYDCDYTRGLLRVVPGLFGLGPARVDHPICGAQGDGCCEFDITWSPAVRHGRRNATLVLAGSGALAAGGLATGRALLLGAAGAIAAGGAAAVGRNAYADARRRLKALEARVAEQDDATERLFATLGDMSSDLRPEEVLDKVARAAGLAVEGKHNVVLLADGDALVAGRHSGVPAASLDAVARWATDHREMLRGGPMLVDDVQAVPGLAALCEDPDVPLGSLCAAPLVFRDEVLGALVALAHGSMVFLPQETAALGAYAAQAAIALSNARLVERLERQAAEDPLTGLANLRAFHRACAAEFARSERDGVPVAIVVLDLDHFKSINDVHGHLYGDDVLRATATALRSAVRPHDIVARMGGEEFSMLLPGADAADAFDVAERARAAIARVPVRDRTLSSSAGVASHPQAEVDRDRLLQLADRALYRAKELGRNRTVEHGHQPLEDADGGIPARRRIAALFEPGGVEVVFQPIVALSTARVICHEALARFPGLPERPISDVFREAHRSGLGPRLEALAVRRALEQPGRARGTMLSVNLSVSALCSAEVWRELPDDLAGLVVEVTEDEVFAGGPELDRSLERLRDAGARIALDDTGAGYAGLQQLMRVRPDVVKLDRSLVAGVASDEARAALVASFASFAAQTGGVVCAEGLEELDDLRAVAALDVTYAQGYLLGRPSPRFAGPVCEAALAVASPLRGGLRTFSAPETGEVPAGVSAPDRVAGLLARATGADVVDLWRLDRRTGDLVAVRADGHAAGERVALASVPARAHALATGEAGQVLRYDEQADPYERAALARSGAGAVLLVGVGDSSAVRGLVACYRITPRPWSREAVARVRSLAGPLTGALAQEPRAARTA